MIRHLTPLFVYTYYNRSKSLRLCECDSLSTGLKSVTSFKFSSMMSESISSSGVNSKNWFSKQYAIKLYCSSVKSDFLFWVMILPFREPYYHT